MAEEKLPLLATRLVAERKDAINDRQLQEELWLQDWRQYKRIYDPEIAKEIAEGRSDVFIGKTKVKCDTIEARLMDILFPRSGERNWEVTPTPEPTLDPNGIAEAMQLALNKNLPVADAVQSVASQRAKNMSKVMADQMAEAPDRCGYRATVREVVQSMVRLGTGILKGPLVEQRIKKVWRPTEKTVTDPVTGIQTVETGWRLSHEPAEMRPWFTSVNLWNFYPDLSSKHIRSCRYVWELGQMLYGEVRRLAERQDFFGQVIRDYLRENKDGDAQQRSFDTELRRIGEKTSTVCLEGRFDVWERWGWLRGDQLQEAGVKMQEEELDQEFFCNVWMLGDKIIKAVKAPVHGVEMPYYLFYCEKDDTSIFGEGIARIMRNPQRALNAAVRAMLDNAGVSAGPIIGINRMALAQGEDPRRIHAFRTFVFDNNEDLKNFMVFHQANNNTAMFQVMIKLFDDMGDEATTPRWVHGDGNVADAAKTASGMSMLMGALSINLTELVKAFDDNVTSPFVSALYHWNMDFNRREDIQGDFSVVARGATALVAKEVRAQQLQQFGQIVTNNEAFAPMVNNRKLLEEMAECMEVGADMLLSEEEVQRRQMEQQAMQARAQVAAIVEQMEAKGIDPSQTLARMLVQAQQAGAASPDQTQNPQEMTQTMPLEQLQQAA